jgi:SAM-dependent methyltransferase
MGKARPRTREDQIYLGNARLPTEASTRAPLVRMISDPAFAWRVVRYTLGLPVRMHTEDRRVLENVIFPYFAALPAVHTVLFVGCDWYTKHYGRMYFRSRNYWTMDPSPTARRFGAAQHVSAPLQDLARHFPEGFFDLIICNGVYGFGLDAREQCETAFEECYLRLAPGGYLVFGWNDIPARDPVPLAQIEAFTRFGKFSFPPLGSWRHLTDTPYRHTYDFYRK